MAGYKSQQTHAPIDPNVNVPAAIRAAAAKSDAIHKQVYTPETPKPQDTNGQDGKTQETQPEATPSATAPTPAATAPASTAGDDWEHKYNSMKGRFDKQDQMLREVASEMELLRAENARLRQAPPAPAHVERTPENTFKKITAEERETYGDDFIDVAGRVARETIDPELARVQQELAELKQSLGQVSTQTQEQKMHAMYQSLDNDLPTWRQINKDPKFLAWANLRDPYSGAIRMNMMREAHAAGNASRVLAFFKGFLSDEAITAPATIQPSPNEGKIPLETLAAPGRAKTSASQVTATPDAKETISRAEIRAFYRDVNAGKYRGNEAEKLRLEQMIFDAERNGRITG